MFEEAALQFGDRTAVLSRDGAVTYGALDSRANRLAHLLRQSGISEGDRVGVLVERSHHLIVALLAVLKAGAAYVPIDPDYPAQRRRFMLEDSAASHVVVESTTRHGVPPELVSIDIDDHAADSMASTAPHAIVGPADLAYVIYTSGSTGRPKGVAVEHRNVVASTAARIAHYRRPPGVLALVPSIAFDSSVAAIFWPLAVGGTVFVPRAIDETGIEQLLDAFGIPVTDLCCVPSLYQVILDELPAERLQGLQRVIVAGERCSRELVRRHYRSVPAATLHNEYGPTEATVWATVHDTDPEDDRPTVPIGRPAAHAHVELLGSDFTPVLRGDVGEIYIGGDAVARGYLGDPALTQHRFVDHALGDSGVARRLYRTGDLARWVGDSELDFVGRVDDQVKINGMRLEIGEVEGVLAETAGVAEAVVMATTEEAGAQRLEAYVRSAPGTTLTSREVRRALEACLPRAMVPSTITVLVDFPRMANGKVDRRSLAQSNTDARAGAPPAQQAGVIQQIVELWKELLAVEEVGPDDNFFDLGGDSLLVLRFVARAKDVGIAIRPRDVFDAQTAGELAGLIDRNRAGVGNELRASS
jgi:amino acid adenylation domain-containing protein